MAATVGDAIGSAEVELGGRLISLGAGTRIWAVKGMFNLGAGQKDGLTYAGLKERMLSVLEGKDWVFSADDPRQESSVDEIAEEQKQAEAVRTNNEPFPLDSTMTVIGETPGKATSGCSLLSPVPWSADLEAEILRTAGPIVSVVCPNLQHWLFALEWIQRSPKCKVYVAPSAHGEDVAIKLAGAAAEASRGDDSTLAVKASDISVLSADSETGEATSRVMPGLRHRLLAGASLAMNEILFFHEASKTLITSDGAYTGYDAEAPPNQQPSWFARLWFKLTKPSGSFRRPEMPVYRTMRVQSHGDPLALRESVLGICKDWDFEQIVGAHGSVPHRGSKDIGDAKAVFKHLWFSGCGLDKLEEALAAASPKGDAGQGTDT